MDIALSIDILRRISIGGAKLTDHASLLAFWTKQLYREFDTLCYHHRIRLFTPVIVIRPLISRLGSYDHNLRTITIAEELVQKHSWQIVLEVLKHEMAHQIVAEIYQSDDLHGALFLQACERLGMEEWAKRASMTLPGPADASATDGDSENITRRIQKLLALADSPNQHEALLAMQKVHELIERYNVAEISAERPSNFGTLLIEPKRKRIEAYQAKIASILSAHYFVQIVYSSLYDAKDLCEYKVIEILGTSKNVQFAEYVYWFLHNNLRIFWNDYRANHALKGPRSRNSFYLGVLNGFEDKLCAMREARADAVAKPRENAPLVVAERKLEGFVAYKHPRLYSMSSRRSFFDDKTYRDGKKQGQQLNLHQGIQTQGVNRGRRIAAHSGD